LAALSLFSPYLNLPNDPGDWIFDPPVLTAPVGWNQPNYPEDVVLVQRIVNIIIDNGYLESCAFVRMQENGTWDGTLEAALKAIEMRYLSGMASPAGQSVVDNGSPLYTFLVHMAAGNAKLGVRFSSLMYGLARVMLPAATRAHVALYLPYILQGLVQNGMADTDMVLMAIATICAETESAVPVSEGASHFNSTTEALQHKPGTHLFDKYDNRSDIGNRGAPDGANFRGHGFVQLTGRTNHTNYQKAYGWPLVTKPELADDPWVAAVLLGRFLKDNESTIRAALRSQDLKAARKAVNGGSNGLQRFTTAFKAGRAFLKRQVADQIAGNLAARAKAL